jgi:hypothetical protein
MIEPHGASSHCRKKKKNGQRQVGFFRTSSEEGGRRGGTPGSPARGLVIAEHTSAPGCGVATARTPKATKLNRTGRRPSEHVGATAPQQRQRRSAGT